MKIFSCPLINISPFFLLFTLGRDLVVHIQKGLLKNDVIIIQLSIRYPKSKLTAILLSLYHILISLEILCDLPAN